MGDGVQAAKAGLLEVADVLVVNKSDRDGADDAVRELRQMVSTASDRQPGSWRPLVVRTVATAEGGISELVEALDKHRAWLEASGDGERRRQVRAAHEIRAIALAMLSSRIGLRADDPRLQNLRRTSPPAASMPTPPPSASSVLCRDRGLGSRGFFDLEK